MNLSKVQFQQLNAKGSTLYMDFVNELEKKQNKWIEEFVFVMKGYIKKIIDMQEAGLKDEIGYINLSLLRTKLLSGDYHIRLDAYHSGWYIDRVECSDVYVAQHLYGRLNEMMTLLEGIRKESFVNFTFGDIQNRFFHECHRYYFIVVDFLRIAIKEVVKTDEFKKLKRAPIFQISFGEYQDSSMIIYKEDYEPKNATVAKRHLEAKEDVYTHVFYNHLDLSKGKFENLLVMFSSFIGSKFLTTSWYGSKLLLCEFNTAQFNGTNFDFSELTELNFTNATFEFASFKGAKLKDITFKNATLIGIDFSETLLMENVDFVGATLIDTILSEVQS